MKKINPQELKKKNEDKIREQLNLCKKCSLSKDKCKCKKKGYGGATSNGFGILVR